MTFLKIYNLEATQDSDVVRTFPEGEYVIGRGDILNCNDKRVSRKHALITVGKDVVTIKSVHTNPCFFKASDGNSVTILPKDTPVVLHEGDQFALLADVFWFKVKIIWQNDGQHSGKNDDIKEQENIIALNGKIISDNEDGPSTSRSENAISNIPSSSKRGSDEEFVVNAKRTKILSGEIDSLSSGDNLLGTTENAQQLNVTYHDLSANIDSSKLINSLRTILEEDYGNKNEEKPKEIKNGNKVSDSFKEEPNVHTVSNSNKVKIEDTLDKKIQVKNNESDATENHEESKDKPGGSNSTENIVKIKVERNECEDSTKDKKDEATGTTKNDPSCSRDNEDKKKSRRERCWYGPSCYRKNPIHHQDFSHVGDGDYDSDPDDDRPVCPFGSACYRKNLNHRRQLKHPNPPAAKPSGGDGTPKKKRKSPKKKQTSNDSSQDDPDADNDDDDDGTTKRKKRSAAKKTNYKEETPEDDYDFEDPFIDDASSDAYEVSDDEDSEDSDWEDSQEVNEESQETRRLLKEAKKFTKGKGKKKDT